MKKLLLSLILLSFYSKAQTYYKTIGSNKTQWDIFFAMYGVSQAEKTSSPLAPNVNYGRYVAVNDTIIAAKNYKKYYYGANTSTVNTHIGYLREDTVAKKVYYLDKTSLIEDLIFDFSLNVGDSIYLNLVPTMNPLPKGYYKVKSIQNTTIKAGIRKEFKLKHTTISSSDTLRFIESVGSIIHPLYLYKNYFGFGAFIGYPSCPFPYDLGLACKWTNNMKEFQSCTYALALSNGCFFKLDSCNYWNNCGGINELSAIKKVTLSPNPAQNHCVVTLDATQESKITADLNDISVRKIKSFFVGKLIQGENEIRLETESLESGLYFISLTGDNFRITQPLTIIH